MNTDIKHIAALVATSIWADGEYDAAEKIVVAEIADAFELGAEEFAAAVEAELAVVEPMTEEEVDNVLSIATALGIDDARAVLMLADLVKEESELQVEL